MLEVAAFRVVLAAGDILSAEVKTSLLSTIVTLSWLLVMVNSEVMLMSVGAWSPADFKDVSGEILPRRCVKWLH